MSEPADLPTLREAERKAAQNLYIRFNACSGPELDAYRAAVENRVRYEMIASVHRGEAIVDAMLDGFRAVERLQQLRDGEG